MRSAGLAISVDMPIRAACRPPVGVPLVTSLVVEPPAIHERAAT